jgi:hypothetical protein
MKHLFRTMLLVLLPACSRCTGENLAPVAEEPPPPATASASAAQAEADGGTPTTLRGRAGDITVKGTPTFNPLQGRRKH